jgi:hypothetical protein
MSNYNDNINQAPPPIYRSPRKHKIFQNSQSLNKSPNKSTPPIQNAFTFGNTPASQPENASNINNLSPNNSMNTVNQSAYQTVRSVKSKVDKNRNNTLVE